MKFYFSLFISFLFTLTINAQIDSQKKGSAIPAIESKKDSADTNIPFPSKENQSNSFNGMAIPKTQADFNVPKKEFSMFGETFGNPGELYEERLSKKTTTIRDEMLLTSKGSKTDQYFGDFTTKSKYAYIAYSDYGEQDGDYISISINDEINNPRVLLTNAIKGFKLELKPGFNKIDFLALTEGYLLPNTAYFKVVDDQKNVITSNYWALSKGVKATIIIVKE